MLHNNSIRSAVVVVAMIGIQQLCLASAILAQSQTTIEQLIQQLGSNEFETRERATNSLLQIGSSVLEPLKNLPPQTSKEIVNRSSVIVRVIEQRNLNAVAKQFLADLDDSNSHGLPAWTAFREIVGNSRFAKMLFIEMVKHQSQIAVKVEEITRLRQRGLDSHDHELQLSHLIEIQSQQLQTRLRSSTLEIGDSVAAMLAVALINEQAPIETSELILQNSQLGFSGYLSRPGFRPCLLQLLSRWVPKSPEAMASEVMGNANFLNLAAVVPIARKHLSKGYDPFCREQAILCIAKFGNKDDVRLLVGLAKDTTVIHKYLDISDDDTGITESRAAPPGTKLSTTPGAVQMVVRINDLAVGVAMALAGEDPHKLFPNYVKDRIGASWRKSVSVPETDTEARDVAIRAWTEGRSGVESVPEPSLTPVPDPNP